MKYKVIDPRGIHLDGKPVATGETVRIPEGAALDAFLHFKQVESTEEKEEEEESEPTAPKGRTPKGKSD